MRLDRHDVSTGDQQAVSVASHYHDYVNGLPYLQKHHGTRIWCYENMVDILEHPHGYKLGCTFAGPVAVERGLEQGETFTWEEYEFQVFHTPGHADYHMAMFGTIDGVRVAFSGDEIGANGSGYASNNIWRNHVHANSHAITARLYLEHQPELTCPGHGGPFRLDETDWKGFHAWCFREQAHWRTLAAPENLEEAIFPDQVFLYPYQPPIAPGSDVRMQVWYQNIYDRESTLEYSLVLPDGWTAIPDSGTMAVAPGGEGRGRLRTASAGRCGNRIPASGLHPGCHHRWPTSGPAGRSGGRSAAGAGLGDRGRGSARLPRRRRLSRSLPRPTPDQGFFRLMLDTFGIREGQWHACWRQACRWASYNQKVWKYTEGDPTLPL